MVCRFLAVFFLTDCTHAQEAEFQKADSIAALYPNHSLRNLEVLSDKLTAGLSTQEGKFRAIYKWVCMNIATNYKLARLNRQKRTTLQGEDLQAWNVGMIGMLHRTLMEKHSTVCSGYALLVKDLAAHAGIQCKVVNGYGRTASANIGGKGFANHTWNTVMLNDKWYLCDPAWSSGAVDAEAATFVRNYEEAYFLADPKLFILNHYPLDTIQSLLESIPTLESFLSQPLAYVNAIKLKLMPIAPDKFKIAVKKKERVAFKFVHNGAPLTKVRLFIEKTDADAQSKIESQNVHTIEHTFTFRGIYAVHILVDDQLAFSYEVTVL